MIKRLCIIGVGLIGGSLARSLREAGYVKNIIGVGRSAENLKDALDLGIIDTASHDVANAVAEADMVVLATPVGTTESIVSQFKNQLSPDTILTDVGSVKGDVIQQIKKVFGEVPANFVPGHPIAGTENSGAKSAIIDLFQNRNVLLTPLAQTNAKALAKVKAMWEVTGASVEQMTADHHDRILAATSHLPHMLAFGLVNNLAKHDKSEEIFRYAAGGFRDFTRIASSDPAMWRDICLHNREAILAAMDNYQADLDELRKTIDEKDENALEMIFTRAKQARDGLAS